MADTTRGTGRIRAWPRKRGRGGTKVQKRNQQNFMNAQRATKYFAPEMYAWFMRQVENSPLLPRDAMTMMLYNRLYAFDLDTGKTLWPMPAKLDVSEALDTISQTEGDMLIRGANGWEAQPSQALGGGAKWKIAGQHTVTEDISHHDFLNLDGYSEFLLVALGIQTYASGRPAYRFSIDNGESFFDNGLDYRAVDDIGGLSNWSSVNSARLNNSTPMTTVVYVTGNNSGGPLFTVNFNRGAYTRIFTHTESPVNAIRLFGDAAVDIRAGTCLIYGR